MNLDELTEMFTGAQLTWRDFVAAGVVFAIGLLLSYLIGRWSSRRLDEPDGESQPLIGFAARVVQVLIIALFAGWALSRLGSDIGFLTVMILVALLITVLAARPILEGMGASAALTTRPTFEVGDEIQVDDHIGEVIAITSRSTEIRRRDGRVIHIPNVKMLEKTVTVFTVDGLRRSSVNLTIGLANDIEHVEQVIREALADIDSIERVGAVYARALTVGIELSIRFWHLPGIQQANSALDDAIRALKLALEHEGIDLAASTEVAIADTVVISRSNEPSGNAEG